jgi:hypothetical protein
MRIKYSINQPDHSCFLIIFLTWSDIDQVLLRYTLVHDL